MCARRSNIYTVDRQPAHVQMATTTLRQSLWRLEPKGLELKVNQAGRRVYRRLKSHRHRTLRTDIHTNRSWGEVVKFCTSEKDSNMPTVTSPFFQHQQHVCDFTMCACSFILFPAHFASYFRSAFRSSFLRSGFHSCPVISILSGISISSSVPFLHVPGVFQNSNANLYKGALLI